MEAYIISNVSMEKSMIIEVNFIYPFFSCILDDSLFIGKYKTINKDLIPHCHCETPGEVRPNILLYNDK